MATSLISTKQLTRLRKGNERTMDSEATILIPGAETADGYGASSQAFTDGATVKCRFRPSTQRADSVEGAQGGNQELFLFAFPVGTVVGVNYRLRRNGIEYEIVGEPTDSDHQLSKKVLAKKL
jgi:hypothetical protein